MKEKCAVIENTDKVFDEHIETQEELSLIDGYKEMSRINLSLAEDGVLSDNDALEICEQKLAECE